MEVEEEKQRQLVKQTNRQSRTYGLANLMNAILDGNYRKTSTKKFTINPNGPNKFSSKRDASKFLDLLYEVVKGDCDKISKELQQLVNQAVLKMEAIRFDKVDKINKN